jgi:hypothetical protein
LTTLNSDIDELINKHINDHVYRSDDKLASEIADKLGVTCINHIKRRIKQAKGEDNENHKIQDQER